jgi:cytochrome c biogenesis protein CcdA/thiol-disulfide isomerase/thioredoxin
MILILLSYVGGILTILSPCILPVLPFVFARAEQPFTRSTLPLLAGMALTFAGVATLAAVGGGWAVQANEYGRVLAMVVLAIFGLALLFPAVADRLSRPVVQLGARLSRQSDADRSAGSFAVSSLVLGIAVGLLWAPCAGPILGIILTGAALRGASASTTLLLLAYALGAATSLAVALLAGGRVFAALKRSFGIGEWIRRAFGVLVLAAVAAVAMGFDTGFLTKLSAGSTNSVEQHLIDIFRKTPIRQSHNVVGSPLPVEGEIPALTGATGWLNSPPLTPAALRGKVVLVDFWTYSCINCLRALPYVQAWYDKYHDHGLVVMGVHSPEFAFEKVVGNVQRAVTDLGVTYPVAIDSDLRIWRAFHNEYWPAHYFIDAQGRIRDHHFGEGDYAQSERVIQTLLREAGYTDVPAGTVDPDAQGIEAPSDVADVQSPETYVGYGRAQNFAGGDLVWDKSHAYSGARKLALNEWTLAGRWTVGGESAVLDSAGGSISFHFRARDLHLVLAPSPDGRPVRFRVTIDGAAPGLDHGTDTDEYGNGVVTTQRLYQLVRQRGDVTDHTFRIEFLDAGVHAFSFTFG